MPVLFHDFETKSTLDLREVSAWRYASDATTDAWCCAYAVDDGPIQLWIPGDPVPTEFIEAAQNPNWVTSAFGDHFERLITQHILVPRYGWPLVPIERRRCSQAAALALALPAKLGSVAQVLKLDHQKDDAGRRAMMQMAQPRRPRKGEDPNNVYWFDDPERREQLYAYCKNDVAVERALHHRIEGLIPDEQALWTLDSMINDRGIYIDGDLLDAAITIAEAAQSAINTELRAITEGALDTVGQTAKLIEWLAAHDCIVTDVQKTTLRRALTRKTLLPKVRRVMELRLDGAHAAANKLISMRNWRNGDGRARGTFRYHGASTGRWTSFGIQVQNMKRPEVEDMGAAIEAVATGNLDHLKQCYPQPMSIVGDITRALICAAPGHRLIAADLSGVESRITGWVSGQQSKLDQWAKFDRTGDPKDEPYFILGKMLGFKDDYARDGGKTADLAFGYMGGPGAWEKLAPDDDASTEAEIKQRQRAWRRAHPSTVRFWGAINRAAIQAVRKPGTVVACGRLAFKYDGTFLRLKLPSGRKLAYPFPRLKTTKFGDLAVVFMDNQGGKWTECRYGLGAYGGTWIENAVQAVARDLFAAAMPRLEAAGYPIVLHVHDEIVVEAPAGVGSVEEFQQIMTTPPAWAEGLPIAAKVRNGERFCKIEAPRAAEPIPVQQSSTNRAPEPEILQQNGQGDQNRGDDDRADHGDDDLVEHRPGFEEAPRRGNGHDGKICCPFHADKTPSCQLYADGHYHCFGCNRHGWIDDDLDVDDAVLARLAANGTQDNKEKNRARALRLWKQTVPILGTAGARYLSEIRKIDLAALPTTIDQVLRFHPRCPFGPARHPCLVALMRDAITDAPTGIQRIALTPEGHKIERRMLGSAGAVKLWPAWTTLVVGEGLETVLAAATRIPYHGAPLQPAWALLTEGALGRFPVLPGIERLITLVDNDLNGIGQAAADTCTNRWRHSGRSVIRLTPKRADTDFNDLIMREAVV
jgi:DNA polymerase